MSTTVTGLFTSDTDLLRHLRRTAVPRGGSIAVMAGQFTVGLDQDRGLLAPLIQKERLSPSLRNLAMGLADDLSLESFRLGARFLHACALSCSAEARILLLVDDIRFASATPLPGSAAVTREQAVQLRRDYLAGSDAVPSTYVRVLTAEGLRTQDALLPRDGAPMHSRSALSASFQHNANLATSMSTDNANDGAHVLAQVILESIADRITDLIFILPVAKASDLGNSLSLVQGRNLRLPDIHLVQLLTTGKHPFALTTRRGGAATPRPDLLKTG